MMLIALTWFVFACLFQAGLCTENTVQMVRAQGREYLHMLPKKYCPCILVRNTHI